MNILTERFKILQADQFYFSLCTCSNTTYHICGAQVEEFGNTIPTPSESVYEGLYDFHDKLLFGKTIAPADVSYMIRNVAWTTGTKYPMYDDKDEDLPTKNFFVVADQEDGTYGVFKCIYKNPITDPVSTYKPLVNQTSADDEVYITGDGYHWKYMFTIDSASYTKFATTGYVPIVTDQAVVNNAVEGTIDAVLIANTGAQYNNYAYGTIKTAAYDGNVLKFAIDTDNLFTVNTYDLVYTGNSFFNEGETVEVTVPGQDAVSAEIYKTTSTSISILLNNDTETITQATVTTANGYITVANGNTAANVIRIREENLPRLSLDNNFYNGSVIYIRNGTGVGQVKDITDYEVTGNDRVITVDSAFSTIPDTTSTYEILPKIQIEGDGSGAIILPTIDSTANSVVDVRVINRGSGYTFANTTVVGNTGIIAANGTPVIANTATMRPIIAPQNGHGADPVEELYGTNIGISGTFANSEVLSNVSYNKVGLIRNLLHDNIQITLTALDEGDFVVGDTVTQQNVTKARGTVVEANTSSNVLTLTNVFGEFSSDANNLIIGATANAEVSSINRSVTTFNNDIVLNILLDGSDEFQAGEIVTQDTSNANGTVIAANNTTVTLVQTFGTFNVNTGSDVIIGATSGARAFVSAVSDNKLVDNSGDVIYIENTNQIDRSATTSEKIKLVIKF